MQGTAHHASDLDMTTSVFASTVIFSINYLELILSDMTMPIGLFIHKLEKSLVCLTFHFIITMLPLLNSVAFFLPHCIHKYTILQVHTDAWFKVQITMIFSG